MYVLPVLKDKQVLLAFRYLLCALAVIAASYVVLKPHIRPVAIVREGVITHVSDWDAARIARPHQDHDIIIHVQSLLPVGKLQMYVDDCLQGVRVNRVIVDSRTFPYCNWFDFLTLDVGKWMKVGSNTVTASLHNDLGGGRLVVTTARASWLFRIMLGLSLASVTAFGAFWFRREQGAASKTVVVALLAGVLLRAFYFAYTDFDTRAYDWDGHLEYIHFIADHWRLPLGSAGWEFHQQPLYYVVGGVMLAAMRLMNAQDLFIAAMQWLSLALSIGTLLAAGWIATMLFAAKAQHAALQRGVFLGFIAVLPGLVMFTSRVNNDVPTLFFAMLCVAFLLHWWRDGTFESWTAMSCMLALALLTKSSALPLCVPVALAFLMKREPPKTKLLNGAVLFVLVAVVVGGAFYVRVLMQGQQELVPVWVTPGLRVRNFPAAFYTFNPWEVLMHPFNQNWIDVHRRQYFWEYLFRSAFFGEWDFQYFRAGALVTLSAGMMLIPLWFFGFVRSLRRPKPADAILAALLAASLLALLAFRYMHPNSSNQELRYVAILTVPVAYFLARGAAAFPVKPPALLLIAVVYACSAALLVLAALHST